MNNKTRYFAIFISLISVLAFKTGDEIELTSYLNARSLPNFYGRKNIVKTLKAGTRGEIKQIKKFYSGNMAFKIVTTNGSNKGNTYWIYYNKKNPGIFVVDEKQREIDANKIDEKLIEEVKKPTAELEEDKTGYLDPTDNELHNQVELVSDITTTIDEYTSQIKAKCLGIEENTEEKVAENNDLKNDIQVEVYDVDLDQNSILTADSESMNIKVDMITNQSGSDFISGHSMLGNKLIDRKSEVDESGSIPKHLEYSNYQITDEIHDTPKTRKANGSGVCQSGGFGKIINLCRNNDRISEININGKESKNMQRLISLRTPDYALSDTYLEVMDVNKSSNSDTTFTAIAFFPRKTMPKMVEKDEYLEVTFANGEIAKMEKDGNNFIGGVLTSETAKENSSPKLNYQGSGVIISVSSKGDPAIEGDIISKTAIISKKGHPDCKVPYSQIWEKNLDLNRTVMKKNLTTDEGLNMFIKNKCNFEL